jgi:guanosine-3',5'-bis(diphosphate) 3'-pyrophosphohydrolase
MDELQESYNKAIAFAAAKHAGQVLPGTTLPYLIHVISVTMEVLVAGHHTFAFELPFAVKVALLHDTLEDTATSYNELAAEFGEPVAGAVLALTKFSNLPKEEQIADSLKRIQLQPKEVWSVKLADRIANLQAPPLDWDYKKRLKYQNDAQMIWDELHSGNEYLARRLKTKIIDYQQFVYSGDK